MCGILGVSGPGEVQTELVMGLTALQHRGQDAAGIVTLNSSFKLKKGLGSVSAVFGSERASLCGTTGIGHVRYATQGKNEVLDAQPYALNYPFGLAMAHNGNVINFVELRRKMYQDHSRLLETSSDLELIVYSLAEKLEKRYGKELSPEDVFAAVAATQDEVRGAYSTVTIIARKGLLAFTDPHGIRPLVMGERKTPEGTWYAFASETACLDCLGYSSYRDLGPGEAVYVDSERRVHTCVCRQARPAFCVFEYLYFAREDSVLRGRLVAGERVAIGKALAGRLREAGLAPDVVIDVPSSAYFFASGLAEELRVPYRRGLAKNNHVGRSFIAPTQAEREAMVRLKLNPILGVVRGKKVAVVDDSIVRGTTSRHIVRLLRDAGAAKVYFVSASPPIRHPCIYGIDMSISREMIAASSPVEEIAQRINADAVVFQSLDDLKRIHGCNGCYACFSGDYPVEGSKETLEQIERERRESKGECHG